MSDAGEVRINVKVDAAQAQRDLDGLKQSAADAGAGIAGAADEQARLSDSDSRVTWQGLKAGSDAARALSDSLTGAGRALTAGVTVPLAALGGLSLNAAVQFESSFAGVRKTVDATEEEFAALAQSARDMALSKPVDVNDVNLVMELGGQLGIAKENLTGFAETISDLDVATDMNVEEASMNLAQFMNITGAGQDTVDRLGATIVDLGNNSATTESAIMDMAMRIAGAGSQIGLTDAEILGLSASLSSVGINAEAGGTAISTVLSEIDKEVALNGESLGTWAQLAGMSVEAFKSAWQNDAAGAIQAVVAGMGDAKAGGENLNIVLDELGVTSIRQTDMMKRLSNAADLMGETMATANSAYEQNTALTAEAERRYETTESKIQMFKNRLNDAAITMGGPLADALSGALDAAQPLIDMVTRAAEGFARMSKEEQQAVLRNAALAAAMGPLLTVAGKLVATLPKLNQAFKMVDASTFTTFGKSVATSAEQLEKMDEGARTASAGFGVLKTVGIAAAVAALGVLYDAMKDVERRAENFHAATDGLTEAAGSLKSASEVAAIGIGQQGDALEEAQRHMGDWRDAADGLAEDGARLADDLRSSFSDAEADAALLQHYTDTVVELAGNCGGSAEKVAELSAALDGVNDIMGTDYQVVDDYSGTINANTDALKANSEAWKENAFAQAAQQNYAAMVSRDLNLQKEHKRIEAEIASKQAELAEAEARRDQAKKNGNRQAESSALSRINELNRELDKQKAALGSIDDQMRANVESMEWLEGRTAEYTQREREKRREQEEAAATAQDYRDKLAEAGNEQEAFASLAGLMGESADGLAQKLAEAGYQATAFDALAWAIGESADDLAESLKQEGVSTENLYSMGVYNFERLAQEAQGDLSLVRDAISVTDALGIDPKHVTITDDGSIATVEGHIIDLSEMTIDGKPFRVTDEGTIAVEAGALGDLDSIKIGGKTFKVEAKTDEAMSSLSAVDSYSLRPKTVEINVSGAEYAQSVIDSLNSRPLYNKTMTVQAAAPRAAGGVRYHADGGVRYHAGGGIATRAVPLDIVGEDGAEAILPLTNGTYLRPFVKTFAAELMRLAAPTAGTMNPAALLWPQGAQAAPQAVSNTYITNETYRMGDLTVPSESDQAAYMRRLARGVARERRMSEGGRRG